MKNVIKSYRMHLTVKGPVFIGSGAEISKKEYVFLDAKRNSIGIVDMQKMYRYVAKRAKKRQFEHFLLDERRMDLFQWMKAEGFSVEELTPLLCYRMAVGDNTMASGRSRLEIREFIKDPYGCPYVPGSSIKGMLRTILLADRIEKQRDALQREIRDLDMAVPNLERKRRNSYLNHQTKQIEDAAFHTLMRNEKRKSDAVNDELSGLIVSDSQPLSVEDLILCQKVELHTDGRETVLNLLRECIRPETQISFLLTVDESVCSVTPQEILSAAEHFGRVYEESFLDAFPTVSVRHPHTVYLGGGAGFLSKTIIYPIYGREKGIRLTKDIFKTTIGKAGEGHKHYKDTELGASPHILKCTRFAGKLLQMGECVLEME